MEHLTVGSLAKISDLSGLATATNVTDATAPLATTAQLTSATSGLATTAQLSSAVSPLATSAILALVKTNTDTINWTDITTFKATSTLSSPKSALATSPVLKQRPTQLTGQMSQE